VYINYKIKDCIEYAMAVTSVRKGYSVIKEKPLYLGRVIDKEQCIFKTGNAAYLSMTSRPTHSAISKIS